MGQPVGAAAGFGTSAEFVPQTNIAAVFSEVEKGHSEFGVVPVENSTEGVVNYTLDKFVESDLKICSEIIIGVTHHLLSRETDLAQVKRVYSHPQALAQCRQWISLNAPQAELKETDSTASAAKRVVSEPGSAAIASAFAADIFGLGVLVANIQDQAKNFTRFLVIGSSESDRTGDDKTSIVFVAKDQVGVLYRLLKPLADAHINLTKIESRPLKNKAWEYMFFVDMEGHISDTKLKKAIVKLQDKCEFFKVLGSYPKSVQNRKRLTKRKS
jgi:chorismate mutase/prephenate dehydratase